MKNSEFDFADFDHISRSSIDTYLCFEGGGAKGIAHVGALQQVERSNSEIYAEEWPYRFWPRARIVGASGTSIGALVAALVVAGYESKDFLDANEDDLEWCAEQIGRKGLRGKAADWFITPFKISLRRLCGLAKGKGNPWKLARSKLLDDLGISHPKYVFGTRGWFGVAFKILLARIPTFILILLLALMIGLGGYLSNFATAFLPAINIKIASFTWQLVPHAFLPLIFILGGLIIVRELVRGSICPNRVADKLDLIIKNRIVSKNAILALSISSEKITFEKLRRLTGKSLKVVATNISKKQLVVFSDTDTPNQAVAPAVLASMALPGVFSPAIIDEEKYVDGGLISNLPAWVWKNEQAYNQDSHVVAIELSSPADEPQKSKFSFLPILWIKRFFEPYEVFFNTIYTGLFGGRVLESSHGGHITINVTPTIDTLSFGAPTWRYVGEFKKASDTAQSGFSRLVLNRHAALKVLKLVHADMVNSIAAVSGQSVDDLKRENNNFRVRVAMVVPVSRSTDSLRTLWTYGYRTLPAAEMHSNNYRKLGWDADDQLLIPCRGTVCGVAMKTNEIQFLNDVTRVSVGTYNHGAFEDDVHRYRRPLIWKREWCAALPTNGYKQHDKMVLFIDGFGNVENVESLFRSESWKYDIRKFVDELVELFLEPEGGINEDGKI